MQTYKTKNDKVLEILENLLGKKEMLGNNYTSEQLLNDFNYKTSKIDADLIAERINRYEGTHEIEKKNEKALNKKEKELKLLKEKCFNAGKKAERILTATNYVKARGVVESRTKTKLKNTINVLIKYLDRIGA